MDDKARKRKVYADPDELTCTTELFQKVQAMTTYEDGRDDTQKGYVTPNKESLMTPESSDDEGSVDVGEDDGSSEGSPAT